MTIRKSLLGAIWGGVLPCLCLALCTSLCSVLVEGFGSRSLDTSKTFRSFHAGGHIGRCRSKYDDNTLGQLWSTLNDDADTVAGGGTAVQPSKDEELLANIREMRVKEIKAELTRLRIVTADAFEKEELVRRLFDARKKGAVGAASSDSSTSESSEGVNGAGTSGGSNFHRGSSPLSDAVSVPLSFYGMDSSESISGVTGTASGQESVYLRPTSGQFTTVKAQIPQANNEVLSLLLDTACSGIVLRPSVVQKCGLNTYDAAVSMTTAGGTAAGMKLATLDRFVIGGSTYGPLPVAVQNTDALPSALDGIMGLSFLSQFACIEFDFRNRVLNLYKSKGEAPPVDDLKVVAEASLSLCRIGVYTVDVTMDGRGPVKMLLDSGASSSFLNWKGVSDLGLSRDSPYISSISSPMGAIGADSKAIYMTHRYVLKRRFNLSGRTGSSSPGLDLSEGAAVNVDIGNLPVLETLQSDGVGGILGADILMRSDLIRMRLNGIAPRLVLYG